VYNANDRTTKFTAAEKSTTMKNEKIMKKINI
jgi:hypothetical protein